MPYTIVIDQQEGAPWLFQGLKTSTTHFEVETTVRHMKTADYAIDGLEKIMVIERKSLEDLYGTLTHGNERFKREMHRMVRDHESSAIVVEADWEAIKRPWEHSTDWRSDATPQSIIGSVFSAMNYYPTVHWFFPPTRADAQWCCFQLLRMAYKKFSEECWEGEYRHGKTNAC